ncbi:MAG: efflux RND transporter periplasmic adaptor subunit [Verrucomicrobiales bacterium]|jgi:HlyD family secretion protein|nr:efflux RND transporter periplasmic adaptor subunit [Verrucomicrobiales bacterium]MDP4790474.1 efflux RND transporter periplasmic adaptor subunit [Verrucomicrobiales bacterium]
MALAVPWLLLAGFGLVLFLLFGDRLGSGVAVKVESVVTARATPHFSGAGALAAPADLEPVDPQTGAVAFQASGWIEPGPYPIKVSALVDGFIDEVLVLEGESVKKGQVLARLIREDFELDLATAEGELGSLLAEAEANEKEILAVVARTATLAKEVDAGKLRLLELEDRRERLGGVSGGAVSAEEIRQSVLRLQTFQGELEALESSRIELESERARFVAMGSAFQAKIAQGKTEVARRRLALERTEVRAPVDGVVLRLFAVPGRKSMAAMDDMDSSTIATLYRPGTLQARIDVPLAEAAGVFPGQAVRVRSDFLPDQSIRGTVSHVTGEADLQRNTLQVKVLLEEPDSRLRPEMLCRAEFLQVVGAREAAGEDETGRVMIYVSVRAILGSGGSDSPTRVMALDGELVRSREVKLGKEERDGYRLVLSGLLPGDRVVLDPAADLADGDRVKPVVESENPLE